MTPTEKHRTDARQVLVGRRLAFAEESGPDALIDGIATALAKAENEASANLIGIISDIRQKSGIGAKPMLGELADAIAERIVKAEREGMKRGVNDTLDALTAHELYQYRPKAFAGFIAYARSELLSEAGESE